MGNTNVQSASRSSKNAVDCNKFHSVELSFHFSCSVNCFKTHKDSGKCEEMIPTPISIVEDKKPSKINLFTTIDTVAPEKLDELENSEKLKDLLKNPHLRSFLTDINSAHNSWNAMRLAMMEPIFLEFANECLNIVEPQAVPPSL
jgi:zinc finger HIT domain-containing protein 3